MKARILTNGKHFRAEIKRSWLSPWTSKYLYIWNYDSRDELVDALYKEYGRHLVIIPAEWRVC